jgi:mannose-1-phosphate guanylyltransferase
MLYAILLAGGHGTRLWPVSRKNAPKQLQPILGADTLLRSTWKRLRKGLPAARILIVTNAVMAGLIRRNLPELPAGNLLVEPMKRDTAAAVGFGAAVALARDPRASVATINSDAHVEDEKEYWRVLRLAERVARKARRLVLVGVRPSYPETGYGYIKMGSQSMRFPRGKGLFDEVFEVEGFREKPDLETAKAYVSQWEYLWNPTLIVAEARTLLGAYKKHLPAMWKQLRRIGAAYRRSNVKRQASSVLADAFTRIVPVSVDYGLLEKDKRMLVLPADFGWADVGHWRAVHEVLSGRPASNVTRGRTIAVDAEGNLLYSFTGKLIAAAGLKDTVVVETEDVILVCPKSRAQDVKKLVEALERRKLKRYL